jgi:hypothetical protein
MYWTTRKRTSCSGQKPATVSSSGNRSPTPTYGFRSLICNPWLAGRLGISEFCGRALRIEDEGCASRRIADRTEAAVDVRLGSNSWRKFWPLAGSAPSSRLAALDWFGKVIQLESVGGRAHESQCIRFVWSGGGAAYRNGGTDAFLRRAFAQRH